MSQHPQGFAEIQRQELARAAGAAMRFRLYAAPVAALIALTIVLLDPAPWRIVPLSVGALLLLGIALFEWWRFRRAGLQPSTVALNVVLMSAFQLLLIFATGALESPLMPAILPLGIVGTIVIGPTPALAILAGLQIAACWLFALGAVGDALPDVTLRFFGTGSSAGHNDALLITGAVTYTLLIGVATTAGLRLRRVFDAMLHAALEAREEALVAHRAHAQELTTLSGEIAHELKNPLASVKALAALLDRDATGRAAERMRILRSEVDRMQLILEEFLNFSRPLTPLACRTLELADTCQDVIALHEGMLRGRGLSLLLAAPPAGGLTVQADPRKVRQILINLVQNAIEASPDGGSIALHLGPQPDGGAWIEVRDRGCGLQHDHERLFAPGMTTRDTGSGLGLTVARALARQHGGEVELQPQAEGPGCVARLSLPPVPEVQPDA